MELLYIYTVLLCASAQFVHGKESYLEKLSMLRISVVHGDDKCGQKAYTLRRSLQSKNLCGSNIQLRGTLR
jgi:hypothetical protein